MEAQGQQGSLSRVEDIYFHPAPQLLRSLCLNGLMRKVPEYLELREILAPSPADPIAQVGKLRPTE